MLENPIKTWWKARKIYKRPKVKFKINRGLVNFYGHIYSLGPVISVDSWDVDWKDKRGTPRVEGCPWVSIVLFGYFQFFFELVSPLTTQWDPEQYWEQILWSRFYAQPDQDPERTLTDSDWVISKSTWPWESGEHHQSTWIDEYKKV